MAARGILGKIKFDAVGLVPAIIQEGLNGRILMMAWMNRLAVQRTLRTGYTHFYSRSRKKMWKKGEDSGHVQAVKEIRVDCDGDVLLVVVRQHGPGACHTGHRSCFYRRSKSGRWIEVDRLAFDPKAVYKI